MSSDTETLSLTTRHQHDLGHVRPRELDREPTLVATSSVNAEMYYLSVVGILMTMDTT